MKEMYKNAGILCLITIMAGAILGFIYELTKGPIRQAEEEAAMAAYIAVFEDASDFIQVPEEEYQGISGSQEWNELGFGGVSVDSVMKAVDEGGQVVGYVLGVTSHEGYGGDITLTAGIKMDGTLNGVHILKIGETPGLGMKAEEVLTPQFQGKGVEQFAVVKTGAVMDSQIDAISGATITSEAVTSAVNGGLYCFRKLVEGGNK